MIKSIPVSLATAALLLAAGCTSDNRIVGDQVIQSGNWYGEFGIVGHLNEIEILGDSRLTKLKIAGDGNKISVADGVPLGKIEIWGGNNIVSIPADLDIRDSVWGKGNQIIRRPVGSQHFAPGSELPEGMPVTEEPAAEEMPVMDEAPGDSPREPE